MLYIANNGLIKNFNLDQLKSHTHKRAKSTSVLIVALVA